MTINYFDAQQAAACYGLDYNKFCAALRYMAAQARTRAGDDSDAADSACDRIYDLLLPGDGYAEKEARKFLERHRPDLAHKLLEAEAGKPIPYTVTEAGRAQVKS